MSDYIVNPKMKGSGLLGCIPQTADEPCPRQCKDCFYQGHGRSYLEPFAEHLPNMPDRFMLLNRVVRVNDGNDSHNNMPEVIGTTRYITAKFYNTSFAEELDKYDAPVVLTVNPGKLTAADFFRIDPIPSNLMMVRVRTNMWNLEIVDRAIEYYTRRDVPVILTFMAYYEKQPQMSDEYYMYRKRTTNSYWAIKTVAWRTVMNIHQDNILVYSCGKIEGERGDTHCRFCGNCLREYFATMERIRGDDV